MKQIRNKVFETNNSSTHSIVIAEGTKEDLRDIPVPRDDSIIHLNTGELGGGRGNRRILKDCLHKKVGRSFI